MRLRWESADPDKVAACLAAVLGVERSAVPPAPARFRLRNATIEVATADRGAILARRTSGDSLVVLDERCDAAVLPDDATSDVMLVAIGIATVDTERFASERGWRLAAAADDDLLGAMATAAATSGTARDIVAGPPGIVLLEPSTEGRIAASLARRGEGPAVLYLRTTRGIDDARAELSRRGCRPTPVATGPFGRACAVGGSAWGPHLVIVDSGVLAGPARTIAP